MTSLSIDRRRLMAAMGATSAVALAGCLSSSGNEQEPTNDATAKTSDEGLDPAKPTDVDRIAADPTDLPDPVDWSSPRTHEIEVTTTERIAEIEPGVTFKYMTFDDQVPGPMIRVRRGDTVRLTLTNAAESAVVHNIDLHAVYGPGGGADDTMVDPGQSATIEFKAMYPGVHVYHCAVPDMDMHISAGMFGAILVEPEDGLPEVDRELYFGQNEIYTNGAAGEDGHHEFDYDGMASEEPTYVTLNGEAYAFTENGYGPVTVQKGERVRIFHANGGPNLTSSWHAIGNVWETLYRDGDMVSDPARYVETTPVVPGSVGAAEIDTPVPGPIKIVDHALSRVVRKGMLGVIQVEGEPEPEIFNPEP
ncbi:copper-containing nitrite reductase [Halovivax ruber]|nr:copper-containing nitrite reductase [Halovivax ruber]